MSDTLQLIIVGIVIAAAVVAAIIRATRRRGNPCDRCDLRPKSWTKKELNEIQSNDCDATK